MHRSILVASLCLLLGLLGGCDQLNEALNRQKSDGKAVGAACRHGGRALEDCYQRNPRAARSDIFTGWQEMDAYMRKNNLPVVTPPPDPPKPVKKAEPEKPVADDHGKEAPVADEKTGADKSSDGHGPDKLSPKTPAGKAPGG